MAAKTKAAKKTNSKAATKPPSVDFKVIAAAIKAKVSKSVKRKNVCDIDLGVNLRANSFTSTGLALLDLALNGGIPDAAITHIWGDSSVGKTAIGLRIAAQFQAKHPDGFVFYGDNERALASAFPKLMGVDLDRVFFVVPETAELTMLAMEEAIRQLSAKLGHSRILLIWDSLASAVTESELAAGYGSKIPGELARCMSKGLKKLRPTVVEYGVPLVILNQCRNSIGQTFGDPSHPCGGNAPIFYSDLSVRLRKIEEFRVENTVKGKTVKGDPYGIKIMAKVDKSRVGVPGRTARFRFYYANGIMSDVEEMYDALIRYRLADYSGGVKLLDLTRCDLATGNRAWQPPVCSSKEEFVNILYTNPGLYQELLRQLHVSMNPMVV